jgi:hypothetical protein
MAGGQGQPGFFNRPQGMPGAPQQNNQQYRAK